MRTPTKVKSREIDVWGYKQFYTHESRRIVFGIQLLIECKNPKSPYVIVGRAAKDTEKARVPFGAKFYAHEGISIPIPPVPPSTASRGSTRRSVWSVLDLASAPGSPSADSFIGNQLVVMERKKEWIADNDHMFNGIVMPMAKAVQSVSKRTVARGVFNPDTNFSLNRLTLPILVTSNDIFEVDTEADVLEAHSKPWSNVTRHIKTDKMDLQLRIDVVQAKHLDSFLDERFFALGEEIAARVEKCPEVLTVTSSEDFPAGAQLGHLDLSSPIK
ncbi:hypothetical protein SAMN04489743_4108 [Pseudarthrobacter equi]|uniref:Uncharacterized protein n=1 Tax=Pseudarthrobacter equi TaxID=728066 RepID=A0A1H2BY79_9MICC|nr:hypothetical protein [Pseudarthrobacter equi]SDT63300.1 hypothetical protein SAMN04489743_4108 [Pseudarthrobacter equi]